MWFNNNSNKDKLQNIHEKTKIKLDKLINEAEEGYYKHITEHCFNKPCESANHMRNLINTMNEERLSMRIGDNIMSKLSYWFGIG